MFTPRSRPHLPRAPRAPSPSPRDPQYKLSLLCSSLTSLSLSLSPLQPQTRTGRKKKKRKKKNKKMLDAILSHLTPAVLFLLLNLVIGTIAFTSSRGPRNEAGPTSRLSRSPSLVFERLKSFNLYSSHRPTEPQTVEIPEPEPKPQPEPESEPDENRNITRSQSDTKPAAGEMPAKLAKKLKKSATLKSAFNHFEFEAAEKRRPATMRERVEEAEEVDARADDFINRFKQQLKLQRLDSLIRYKEMISRGS